MDYNQISTDELRLPSILSGWPQNASGWVKIDHFRRKKTRYNSKTVQDRCIASIKVE